MRKKIAHANKSGSNSDVVGQQHIEYPRALCTIDGLPVKDKKSIATTFYKARYKDESLITHTFPNDWIAGSVMLEGMFLINTKPHHCHQIMKDCGNFRMRQFIVPLYLKKGSQEVHVLFDDPGRQVENPKQFEQSQRDTSLVTTFALYFFDDAEVPMKWQNTIKCRICKRLGLHLKYSAGTKEFILSPDTDVYHIGLSLVTPSESVIVQLSIPSHKELKLLHLKISLLIY